MKIVHNFEMDGNTAANFAFKLVKAHAMSKISKQLCKNYGINRSCYVKNNPPNVVVFDIDDTLKFSTKPHTEIVNLYHKLQNDPIIKPSIHIVTARIDDKDYIEETKKELLKIGIDHFDRLIHAPNKYRKNLGDVGIWKETQRLDSSLESKSPYIVLTVGDQWGDVVSIKNESEIDELDKIYGKKNYILLRPDDEISLWGLKLPAN